MNRRSVLVLLVPLSLVTLATTTRADWTRFRGPDGQGLAENDRPIPTDLSAKENIRWKAPLPGSGVSSPIVVGDRVYVTAYTGYGLDMGKPGNPESLVRHLLAFDRATGDQLWRRDVASTGEVHPYFGFVPQHGYASSTPASDGENVYALFGSTGLIKYDRDGDELWRANVGTMKDPMAYGDASSPIIYKNLVIVNASAIGRQLVAVDKENGEIVWSIKNEDFTNSWSTPVTVSTDQGDRVLFGVPGQVIAVDPMTGQQIWSAQTPIKDAVCASVVIENGVAYIMGGRNGQAVAIRLGGRGDVTDSHVVWQRQIRSSISTPVVFDGKMYWASTGIFYAADLSDGEYVFRERLPRKGAPTGSFPNVDYSSPIIAGGNVLLFTRNGESYQIQPSKTLVVAQHNAPFAEDDSSFSSTPAVDDGQVFLRSQKYLYCIGARQE